MNRFDIAGQIWTGIALPIQNGTAQLINALMQWVGNPFKLGVVAYLVIILLIAAWSSDESAFQRFSSNSGWVR